MASLLHLLLIDEVFCCGYHLNVVDKFHFIKIFNANYGWISIAHAFLVHVQQLPVKYEILLHIMLFLALG